MMISEKLLYEAILFLLKEKHFIPVGGLLMFTRRGQVHSFDWRSIRIRHWLTVKRVGGRVVKKETRGLSRVKTEKKIRENPSSPRHAASVSFCTAVVSITPSLSLFLFLILILILSLSLAHS